MLRYCTIAAMALVLHAPISSAQTTLELKYVPGTAYQQRLSVQMEQKLELAGQEMETTIANNAVSRVQTKTPDAGLTPVAIKVDSLQASLTLPGGLSVHYDSANPGASHASEPVAFLEDLFRTVKDLELTYQVDASGKASRVDGAREALATAPQQAAEMLKHDFDPERLKREFNQEAARIPAKPVNVGDTWSRKESRSLGAGQTFEFDIEYAYQGVVEKDGKSFDRITSIAKSVAYAVAAGSPAPQASTSDLKVADWSGEILFDREAGRVRSEESKGRITGELIFDIQGNQLPAKLDLTMQQSVVND